MLRKGFGQTDTGIVRTSNEDAILVINEQIGFLRNVFAVADGMGGHNAGEIASSKAIQFFCNYLKMKSDFVYSQILLSEAITYANDMVYIISCEDSATKGMGTTFSACSRDETNLYYAHIGDSRIYVLNSEIRQITEDHSFVNEMVKSGQLTKEEAFRHEKRNMLTRALGTERGTEADYGYLEVDGGDTVLICSDGLTNMLSDADILNIVTNSRDKQEAVNTLIEEAKKNGGIDNISAVLI